MSGRARAVIGAGYGDEGKGLVTDLEASLGASVAVRTNGGAQAGHTVTAPDGRRHVFHHVGSGALAGAATHLSRHFVSNPMFLEEEAAALGAHGARVSVSADPRGLVTTPWDMMLNQAAEAARGRTRHGSCGLGFGETIERSGRGHLLTVASAAGSGLEDRLDRVRREWLPLRAAELGLDPQARELAMAMDDGVLAAFVDQCSRFSEAVRAMPDSRLGEGGIGIVFEGAQGLMLDQDHGAFPHVTRSNTGLLNMAAVALEAGIGRIDVTYVTRAYVTRHGAGPLAHEAHGVPFAEVVDPTNVPNDWQGTIRYAPLDLDVLGAAVARDVAVGRAAGIEVGVGAAVTCLDQVRGMATAWSAGRPIRASAEALAVMAWGAMGASSLMVSHGPSRDGISVYGAGEASGAA